MAKAFLMRCSEDELAEIDRAAKEAQQSRTGFVREAALHQARMLATAKKMASDALAVEHQTWPHG